MEETVKGSRRTEEEEGTAPQSPPTNVSNTPGRTTAQAVTPQSKCDYSVYTMRNNSSFNEVVAVLIEAKTTQHPRFKHTIAQVTSLVPE